MKKCLLIIFLLPILLFSQQTTQSSPQSQSPTQINFWNKIPDDSKHVYASGLLMITASEIAFKYNHNINKSLLVGTGVSLTIGILGKEFIYDKWLGYGVYSNWDIFYDCWGNLIFILVERVWMDVRGYGRDEYEQDYFDSQIKHKKHKTKWSLKNTGLLR